ncbi:YfhE family protein [Alkalicoccus halolimnae]|uniref:YfhE family protein n=1 Tax=Alkalicoccus halolimnae TaxID=1667239 RepID=A0A5C7FGU1_9BACI|nr:YfhE family protein [Alkalicoccus halolimnae]TXF85409.1 YfhE family protein [Alkalicoccus halolimnae]
MPSHLINERNNGMSSAQEVLYSKDYKQADRAAQNAEKSGGQ